MKWKTLMKKLCLIALASTMVCTFAGAGLAFAEETDAQEAGESSGEASGESDGESRGGRGDSEGSQGAMGGFAYTDKSTDEVLQSMIAEALENFDQYEYLDEETGLTLPYNLYLPENYDASQSYPMVVFIADSSVSGQDVTAPLTQGYGGVIWASSEEQAKHECIVLVPAYPETILDDHNGHTTTEYVEMTVRLINDVSENYAVDTDRIYATGQSMGCMTFLILASEYEDLFAAEIFVSGQWDVNELDGIASQTCFYITAAGDPGGSTGQAQLYEDLTAKGVAINGIDEWDAQWSQEEFDEAIAAILSESDSTLYFGTFITGSTLPEGSAEGSSEHMTSFDFAYKIDAVRDWLFQQSK